MENKENKLITEDIPENKVVFISTVIVIAVFSFFIVPEFFVSRQLIEDQMYADHAMKTMFWFVVSFCVLSLLHFLTYVFVLKNKTKKINNIAGFLIKYYCLPFCAFFVILTVLLNIYKYI